jgi:WD40 repeat protein
MYSRFDRNRRIFPLYIFAQYLCVWCLLTCSACGFLEGSKTPTQSPTITSPSPPVPHKLVGTGEKLSPSSSPEIVGLFHNQQEGNLYGIDGIGSIYRWTLSRESGSDNSSEGTLLTSLGVLPREVAYNANRNIIAIAYEKYLAVYSISSLTRLHLFGPFPFSLLSLDFDSPGSSLVAGVGDGKILRWRNLDEAPLFERYVGPNSVIGSVRFHPSGKLFFSGDWAGALSAWTVYEADIQGGAYDQNVLSSGPFTDFAQRLRAGKISNGALEAMSVSSDGEWLAVGTGSGKLFLWKVRGFRKVIEVTAHSGAIRDTVVSANGREVVSLGRDDVVRFWHLEDKGRDATTLLPQYELVPGDEATVSGARTLTFIDEGRVLVGTRNGTVAEVTSSAISGVE